MYRNKEVNFMFDLLNHYHITLRNGVEGTYLVIGVMNKDTPVPCLRVQHTDGFFGYIQMENIVKMVLVL